MRLYVECIDCGRRDSRPPALEEALDFHGHELSLQSNGDFTVADVCEDCCEAIRATDWAAFEEPPF